MEGLEFPIKLIRLIGSYWRNSKSKINFNDHVSKEFVVITRLTQGDTLYPIFFNIALESVVGGLFYTNIGIRLQNKKINLIPYADDLLLFGKTEEEINTFAEVFHERSKSMRLIVNEEKTKYMLLDESRYR